MIGTILVSLTALNLVFGFSDAVLEYIKIRVQTNINPSALNSSATQAEMEVVNAPQQTTTEEAQSAIIPVKDAVQVDSTLTLNPPRVEPPRPVLVGYIPDRIQIPAINLDAPIIYAQQKSVQLKDQWFSQWLAPDEFAAGWMEDSAPLGLSGNTVISGHHNVFGKVFGKLVELQPGDKFTLSSGLRVFEYRVDSIHIIKEKDVSLSIRQENARWIAPTADERITLVTCWPKRSNTHRLIVVAFPVREELDDTSYYNNR